MDGKSVLDYFGGRIAAEIRLPEAIDRKLLCPFQYFGVTDAADLSSLKWRTGGYDKNELSNLYTLSGMVAERRADLVVNSILKYVTDIDEVKGLGFCVSIAHAQFMARYFNTHGIPSMALTGDSPDEERNAAKQRLVSGELRFLFVVDIYNEGVDIPEVNTVLFLRPTESLTVFLQQLGRGLRLAENKDCLTVLDFIGQANKKYNFEEKFAALLSNTTRSVSRELKEGFVSAPKGCYIQLEKIAAKYVLDNISASYDRTSGLVARATAFTEDTGLPLTLGNFLDYYHLDPRAIYSKKVCFSRLCVRAGAASDFAEPLEETMTKAFARFAVIDSRRWIRFLLGLLPKLDNTDFAALSPVEKRMLQLHLYPRPAAGGAGLFEACHCPRGREVAAGKAAGRILCDPEQGRQGLLPHHHVQGLFHQRKPVPLAEPEHHRRKLCHRAALHPSPGKRKPGSAVRARVQGRCPFWRCRGVYLFGHGELCEARGLPPHEHHMEAGPPDPCKVPQKDQQAGGRLKGEYHEGCSRCRSCDLRRYSDET